METDVFVVIESNTRYRFARLRSESSGQLLHTELYVEREGGAAERLHVGDRVGGRVRGQSLHAPFFVERAAPPEQSVADMESLLAALGRFGLQVPLSARQLAEEQWRSREAEEGLVHASLREALHPQLTFLFDWEQAHPLEDPRLLDRLAGAMRPHVPGYSVELVPGEGHSAAFLLQPRGVRVPAGEAEWEHPTPRYAALVEATNALLEHHGAAVRWVRLREDWLLAPPELARLLMARGLLLGPLE